MHNDQATATDYDDPMCSKLLGTAADVLRSFGSAFGDRHLAIVGGAVPSLLVGRLPERLRPHVGTADLDFHLSLHLLDGETADYYQAIIDGLRSLGLRTDVQGGREVKWRWVGRHRGAMVQVEFLCPMRDRAGRPEKPAAGTPAEANIGPAGEITALAVGYGQRASWKRTKATRTGDMHWGRWQPSAGHSLRAGSSSRFTGPFLRHAFSCGKNR